MSDFGWRLWAVVAVLIAASAYLAFADHDVAGLALAFMAVAASVVAALAVRSGR